MLLSKISALRFSARHHRRHEELATACRRASSSASGVSPLSSLHGDIGGRRRDDLARLGDRVVLVARDDQLQRGDRRVVAGDRRHRIDAGRLEGGDGAAAGAVIGRDDADDLVAEAGDLAARPFLCLRRRPVGRVEFGQRLDSRWLSRPAWMPSLDQAGGRVGRRAVDLQHAAAFGRHARGLQMLRPAIRRSPCRCPHCRRRRRSRPARRGSAGHRR